MAALAQVDVDLWWREPVGGARFYFDKAECVAVVCDEIDFGFDDSAAQVSTDGKVEVGSDETIAKLFEVGSSVRFTKIAE